MRNWLLMLRLCQKGMHGKGEDGPNRKMMQHAFTNTILRQAEHGVKVGVVMLQDKPGSHRSKD